MSNVIQMKEFILTSNGLEEVTTDAYPLGTRLYYGNAATPPKLKTIVEQGELADRAIDESGYESRLSHGAHKALGGFSLADLPLATPEEIEALKVKATAYKEQKTKEHNERQAKENAYKALALEKIENRPANKKGKQAVGVILLEFHKTKSDSMTDYYGYERGRSIVLGWTFSERNNFNEMRKLARLLPREVFEVGGLPTHPDNWHECRENYSGGGGFYLSQEGCRNRTGWNVKKVVFGNYTKYCDGFDDPLAFPKK